MQVDRSFSQRIEDNIARFKNSIHFIEVDALSYKSKPNKWSKKEILGHLIDSARYNLQRFNEIPHHRTKYTVASYQQDALVKGNNYQEADLQELIMLWQLLNKQISRTISYIPEADLQIKFTAYEEERDLEWLIEDYIVHLEHHLNQILENNTAITPDHFPYHLSTEAAAKILAEAKPEFITLMQFGDLEVEYYKPHEIDKQTPHDRDELYFISKGSGEFICEDKKTMVKTGGMVFVKAGDEHRFVNFSDDFETWVVFYGIKR